MRGTLAGMDDPDINDLKNRMALAFIASARVVGMALREALGAQAAAALDARLMSLPLPSPLAADQLAMTEFLQVMGEELRRPPHAPH